MFVLIKFLEKSEKCSYSIIKTGNCGTQLVQGMSVLQSAVQRRISEDFLAPVSEYFHSGSLAKATSLSVSAIGNSDRIKVKMTFQKVLLFYLRYLLSKL